MQTTRDALWLTNYKIKLTLDMTSSCLCHVVQNQINVHEAHMHVCCHNAGLWLAQHKALLEPSIVSRTTLPSSRDSTLVSLEGQPNHQHHQAAPLSMPSGGLLCTPTAQAICCQAPACSQTQESACSSRLLDAAHTSFAGSACPAVCTQTHETCTFMQ